MKHTGLVVHIGDVVSLLSDYAGLQALAVAPCRAGDAVVGIASPPEITLGSPSVRDVASSGGGRPSALVTFSVDTAQVSAPPSYATPNAALNLAAVSACGSMT